jgi:hypothetical protein
MQKPLKIRAVRPSGLFAASLSLLGRKTPREFSFIGEPDLLDRPSLGFLCSARCAGDAMLAAYEVSKKLDPAGEPVLGGFHSPLERQFLEILLVRHVPVIICVPRPLKGVRIASAWRVPIDEGRLVVMSPVLSGNRRFSRSEAEMRNAIVAAAANPLFIPYAFPGGSIERLLSTCAGWGKTILTVGCNDQPVLREVAVGTIEGWLSAKGVGCGQKKLVLV